MMTLEVRVMIDALIVFPLSLGCFLSTSVILIFFFFLFVQFFSTFFRTVVFSYSTYLSRPESVAANASISLAMLFPDFSLSQHKHVPSIPTDNTLRSLIRRLRTSSHPVSPHTCLSILLNRTQIDILPSTQLCI